MAEEESASPRPRGFTLDHSFIINLPQLGFGAVGIPPQTDALLRVCCSSVNVGGLSLKRERKRKNGKDAG